MTEKNQKISVLFVCLGNICRSPMAEAVFRHLIKEKNLDKKIEVASAGTSSQHEGEKPHIGTRTKLKSLNIDHNNIVSNHLKTKDIENYDYILGMDDSNIENIKKITKEKDKHKILKFIDFVPDATYAHVPDPWFTNNFDFTYELVNTGCKKLLDHVCEKHNF